MTPDWNMVATGCTAALIAWTARTMLATAKIVERLDERSVQHDKRITRLESVEGCG